MTSIYIAKKSRIWEFDQDKSGEMIKVLTEPWHTPCSGDKYKGRFLFSRPKGKFYRVEMSRGSLVCNRRVECLERVFEWRRGADGSNFSSSSPATAEKAITYHLSSIISSSSRIGFHIVKSPAMSSPTMYALCPGAEYFSEFFGSNLHNYILRIIAPYHFHR
jgi:hypothetical protein